MAIRTKLPDPERARDFFRQRLEFTLGPAELKHLVEEGQDFVLIDVRDPQDYAEGHIKGAVNLTRDRWEQAPLAKDRLNVFYCYSQQCHLGAAAAAHFAGKGFPVMEVEGGFQAWKDYGYDIERGVAGRQVMSSGKRVA